MTLNRLILLFLGFIFLIIVILSSRRISIGLRQQFGRFIPSLKPASEKLAPSLTPTPFMKAELLTPTPTIIYATSRKKEVNSSKIPATGPEDFVWVVLGGGILLGLSLRRITASLQR